MTTTPSTLETSNGPGWEEDAVVAFITPSGEAAFTPPPPPTLLLLLLEDVAIPTASLEELFSKTSPAGRAATVSVATNSGGVDVPIENAVVGSGVCIEDEDEEDGPEVVGNVDETISVSVVFAVTVVVVPVRSTGAD